jgi:RecB family exonuclease
MVLVPRSQIGRALEDALAREESGWAGLSTVIVRHYAEQIARPRILASGRTELPVGGRSFLAARLLEALQAHGHLEGLPGPAQLASTVADALETLRRAGAALQDVQARAEAPDASATFRVVAACYERYLQALADDGLYDDAQVFRWAAERVRAGVPSVEQSVVAVSDAVDLPERAYAFLRAVQNACAQFYRLGAPAPHDAPPQTAAARCATAAVPPADRAASKPDGPTRKERDVRLRRAVGARNEVDALFRDVLAADVPLDEVEIAVAGEQPYVSLLAARAEQMGLPLSLGTGRPAAQTRTGAALLAFLEWITEGFAPDILIRMLRSGRLRIDRVHDDIADATGPVEMEAHEAATRLAARRYEPGRDGYKRAFEGALHRLDKRIDDLEARGLAPDRDRTQRRELAFVHRLVQQLLDLVPRRASIQTMAARARTFIETFGPVDPPPEKGPEAERTLDEAARGVLWQRVDRLAEVPVHYEASGPRLAQLLRRWLRGQYVRAEHPRPGTAHVVPLESAAYGDRSHLFVVGMDSDTLSTAAVEDALLRDHDRRALGDALEGVLAEQRVAPDDAQWRHEQALARHAGPLSLYTRVFDIERGEERFPAPLFLQLEEATGTQDAPPRSFLPTAEAHPLSDLEAWLAAYRARGETADPAPSARAALATHYPWIEQGEAARAARAADTYTVHDGLLDAGAYPTLDFLGDDYDGPPMSAGRLETFAATPYLYFLKYVLGVEPLDEPALDDEPWLNALRRGSILHDTFEAFLRQLDEPPRPSHEALLTGTLDTRIEEEASRVAPPSEGVKEAARRQLLADAQVFLRSEVERGGTHTPLHHEVGFGYGAYRRHEGDFGELSLSVDGRTLPLRGRIDRVDRRPDGTLAVWDYKTGRRSSFDEGDPLKDGAQLQWALYAYALEALTGETVTASGYYFPTTKEMGTRLAFDPAEHRAAVTRHLQRLARLAASGTFPMHPKARYRNAWMYRGYDRLFPDLAARSRQLQGKTLPDDRPVPPSF